MESRSSPGPATLGHHDAVLGCLRAGGLSLVMAAHAFNVIDSYVYGFALQETSLPFQSSGELEDMAATILEQVPAEEFPHLTEMIVDHALRPGYAYAEEFTWGLDLLLDALERSQLDA